MKPAREARKGGARRFPPQRIYLEVWPEAAQRDTAVHFEQVGYGDDMRGNTSSIYVYERVPAQPRRSARRKRK